MTRDLDVVIAAVEDQAVARPLTPEQAHARLRDAVRDVVDGVFDASWCGETIRALLVEALDPAPCLVVRVILHDGIRVEWPAATATRLLRSARPREDGSPGWRWLSSVPDGCQLAVDLPEGTARLAVRCPEKEDQ
jgi:hypothetical protein